MTLLREADSGTPIRPSDEKVTLTIDGSSVTVPKGTSVMSTATCPDVAAVCSAVTRPVVICKPCTPKHHSPK